MTILLTRFWSFKYLLIPETKYLKDHVSIAKEGETYSNNMLAQNKKLIPNVPQKPISLEANL